MNREEAEQVKDFVDDLVEKKVQELLSSYEHFECMTGGIFNRMNLHRFYWWLKSK